MNGPAARGAPRGDGGQDGAARSRDGRRDAPSAGAVLRTAWRALRWPLGAYLGILLLFATLQRKLIYLPLRDPALSASTAGFSPGRAFDVAVPTSDGLELHGWHVLPRGSSADDAESARRTLVDDRPVVVYFSGNGAHRGVRDDQCKFFANRGCHVILVDYRGYGDNAGSPSEEGLAEDARSIWKYVVETCGVSRERVILFGESLGGGVATRLARDLCVDGRSPAALVIRSSFSSLVDAASYHYPWLPVRWALVDRFESTRWIGEVDCAYLHFHGDADDIVPWSLGRALFEAAPERSRDGVAKRWVTLAGAGHNDVLRAAGDEMARAMDELLVALAAARHQSPTAPSR